MTRPLRPFCLAFTIPLRSSATLAMMLALVAAVALPARGQTYQVIHTFQIGDGATPAAGLTMDAAGRLYGTTASGGAHRFGTVFKLARAGSGWTLSTLYSFKGDNDGAAPAGRVSFGSDGALYGTTYEGGGNGCNAVGCGTVFKLKPSPSACKTALCPWNETILHAFNQSDGNFPLGDLLFDASGNIYGVTSQGGVPNLGGVVYELTPSGGGWTQSILYSFGGSLLYPSAGVIFDKAGNLYGTLLGSGDGHVFQLAPATSGWVYNEVYALLGGGEGGLPEAGLIFDDAGSLYGASTSYGGGGGGTVFKLTPSNGGWTLSILYSFVGVWGNVDGPIANLVTDKSGNLYGTTYADGAYGMGSVFKLIPRGSGWSYTSLHDFTGGADGANPKSNVIFDANGNLYGTASTGGNQCSCGVVWEITP